MEGAVDVRISSERDSGGVEGEARTRPPDDLTIVFLYVDWAVVVGHTVVPALGVDVHGGKHRLELWKSATENGSVCRGRLENLMRHGLKTDRGLLAVADGSKALRGAVADVLGSNVPVHGSEVPGA